MSDPTKAALRAALLQRRQGRDPEDNASRSAALLGHLVRHPLWRQARGVAAFVGVRGEPDTWGLLAATLAEGKRLWLPRMEGRPSEIAFVPVHDLRELAPGGFGLLAQQRQQARDRGGLPGPRSAGEYRGGLVQRDPGRFALLVGAVPVEDSGQAGLDCRRAGFIRAGSRADPVEQIPADLFLLAPVAIEIEQVLAVEPQDRHVGRQQRAGLDSSQPAVAVRPGQTLW